MTLGLTIPLSGISFPDHEPVVRALPDLGYTDVWSSEVAGFDAFTPLAAASVWAPALRLGTAIVPVFTRGPALIAMSAASLAALAPGRVVLGLGTSSPTIVDEWNGMSFAEPYRRARDVLRFVRSALARERISHDYSTFSVRGFRLENPPAQPPPIALAALRPQMLALAGREADGALLNWLAASDVPKCVAAIANVQTEVIARIFVCPSPDADYARTIGRRLIAAYLTVPAYAAFHEWLGRGDLLEPMWSAWAAGDRKAALAAISDDLVDDLVVHGSPEQCRERVAQYVAAGIDTPVLAILPTPSGSITDVLRRLGGA